VSLMISRGVAESVAGYGVRVQLIVRVWVSANKKCEGRVHFCGEGCVQFKKFHI
jgi:hypothetical protein